jgi:ABC-type antimicrobial peptide transport system permease subunit
MGVIVEPVAGRIRSSRFPVRDLLAEATTGMLSRPGRTTLTILGTVLGTAALVATLGLAKTAGNQIVEQFDALAATSITVETYDVWWGGPRRDVSFIPWDAEDRLVRLNGVVAAGTLSAVDVGAALATSVPFNDPTGRNAFAIPVYAASPGLFDAIHAKLDTGRFFDAGHSVRAERVAVLGPAAAQRLNITLVDQQPAIFLGDEILVVIGILEDVAHEAKLLDAIVVPNGTARRRFGLDGLAEVHIRTEVGAAQLIGSQAALALHPNDPDELRVRVPPEPGTVRSAVEEEVNTLFIVLGGISLLVGAIGIANVTLVSVLERVGEIGLRRAVGAARRHIAVQFLAESAVMGLVGGILGSAAGVLVIVGVSAGRDWTPVLEAVYPLGAPLVGALVGLLAGLYPAWRAARLEPVEALREL